MPCMKRVYEHNYATIHWSAARDENHFSSWKSAIYEPVVGQQFYYPIGLYSASFVRASGESFKTVVSDVLGKNDTVVSLANRPVGTPCSAIPARPAGLPWAAPT